MRQAPYMRDNVRCEHKLKLGPKALDSSLPCESMISEVSTLLHFFVGRNNSTLVQAEESTDEEVPSLVSGSENVVPAIKAKSVPIPATRSSQRTLTDEIKTS